MTWGHRLLALSALSLTSGPVTLQTEYEVDQEVRFESESNMSMELGECTIKINGQELPPELQEQFVGELGELAESGQERIAIVNTFLELDEGEPIKVRRTYETAREEGRSGEGTTENVSDLEGRTLLLHWDGEEVVAEADDEGEELDEAFLIGHILRLDYDYMLPDGEVEVGDSWELDKEAMFGAFEFAELFEAESESEEAMTKALIDSMEDPMKVTFEAIRSDGDEEIAVLRYEFEFKGALEDAAAMLEVDDEGFEANADFDFQVNGELLFDMSSSRGLRDTWEMKGILDFDLQGSEEAEGMEFLLDMDVRLEMVVSTVEEWTFDE